MSEGGTPGYYGKLPCLGDFAMRRLPRAFIDPWDRWLQKVVACSREQLGDAWLDTYLTSPLWRFAFSAGLIGEGAWSGVLMPSADRVGRVFPFAVVAPLPAYTSPMRVVETGEAWFERAEAVMLAALDDDFTVERLEELLAEVGPPAFDPAATGAWPAAGGGRGKLAMHLGLVSIDNFAAILPELAGRLLHRMTSTHGVWWTGGSDRVAPSVLITEGLPPVTGFAAFLDGDWSRWGWQEAGAPAPPSHSLQAGIGRGP